MNSLARNTLFNDHLEPSQGKSGYCPQRWAPKITQGSGPSITLSRGITIIWVFDRIVTPNGGQRLPAMGAAIFPDPGLGRPHKSLARLSRRLLPRLMSAGKFRPCMSWIAALKLASNLRVKPLPKPG
jgi:hypothetical protein